MEEGDQVEFKRSFDILKSDSYRRTMNAFLNTRGGTIYFGIRDDGIVVGIESNPQSVDKFRLWVDQTQHEFFSPSVYNITVRVHKLASISAVWAIHVPQKSESMVPIYYRQFAFCRLNASTVARKDNVEVLQTKIEEMQKKADDQLKTKTEEIRKQSEEAVKAKIDEIQKQNEQELVSARLKRDSLQQALDRLADQHKTLVEQHRILGEMTKSLVSRHKPNQAK